MSKNINDIVAKILSNKIRDKIFKLSNNNINTKKLRWKIIESIWDTCDFYREIHDFIGIEE